jgi:S-adenosylmethionine hydrolase
VVGVNAGYAFSFVRDDAEELRWASVPAGGSQFRSRDLFPEAAGDIVAGVSGALANEIDPSKIPDVPNDRIVYVDGYGNLKTTTEHGALATSSGTVLRVHLGDVEREATASDGSFEVEEGELAFAPGSSGWPRPGGQEVRWMELFLRGGSAWEAFGHPGVGSRLEIAPDL